MSRLRILWGATLLVAGLALYALVMMKIAVEFVPDHWAAELAFYLVAGTAWVWPAAKLTYWMQDLPDPRGGKSP